MDSERFSGRSPAIKGMFEGLAGRYDLLNRLITLGQDRAWRRFAIEAAAPPRGGRLLDIGAGTGGLALEALRMDQGLHLVCVDFSLQMMVVGMRRRGAERLHWCAADALALPFSGCSFDAVISGYLMRNVGKMEEALREQVRVLKPGGRVVCLDTSPPPPHLLRPLVGAYLRYIIPLFGQLVARQKAAYQYLQESTRAFVVPQGLAGIMVQAGLVEVSWRRFMLGTQAVVWGMRPRREG